VEQIDDVLAVMASMSIRSAHVVGLSRGAITAFGGASRHPGRADSLILGFPVSGFADTILVENPDLSAPDLSPPEQLDHALRLTFSADFLANHRADALALFMSTAGSVVRVDRKDEEPLGSDETVDAPTLILSGSDDRIALKMQSDRLIDAIPHASAIEIPGAFHGYVMKEPDEVARLLVEFLARL